jgi:hypothetical protein
MMEATQQQQSIDDLQIYGCVLKVANTRESELLLHMLLLTYPLSLWGVRIVRVSLESLSLSSSSLPEESFSRARQPQVLQLILKENAQMVENDGNGETFLSRKCGHSTKNFRALLKLLRHQRKLRELQTHDMLMWCTRQTQELLTTTQYIANDFVVDNNDADNRQEIANGNSRRVGKIVVCTIDGEMMLLMICNKFGTQKTFKNFDVYYNTNLRSEKANCHLYIVFENVSYAEKRNWNALWYIVHVLQTSM